EERRPRREIGNTAPGIECAADDNGGEYQQGRPGEPNDPSANGVSKAWHFPSSQFSGPESLLEPGDGQLEAGSVSHALTTDGRSGLSSWHPRRAARAHIHGSERPGA